jgi:hypothetical protein
MADISHWMLLAMYAIFWVAAVCGGLHVIEDLGEWRMLRNFKRHASAGKTLAEAVEYELKERGES